MEKSTKRIIPPRGKRLDGETIFAERFVVMRGLDYYMRQFYNGSTEFVRFDETARKWVYLYFVAA